MTPSIEVPSWVPEPDDERGVRRIWWGIGLVIAAGVVVFLLRGANEPANPSLLPAGVTTPAGVAPTTTVPRTPIKGGFGETALEVRAPDGSVLDWCLLLAATLKTQQQGLMKVTDPKLGGYDGMLFRFSTDSTVPFYMRNTPMPLSIAYIDGAGTIVSTVDMAPCGDLGVCPTYPAAGPYRIAIEVPQGGLARLGIVAGATVVDANRPCKA